MDWRVGARLGMAWQLTVRVASKSINHNRIGRYYTMDTMAYKWVPGSRVPVSAQVAGEVCEKLQAKGMLTPEKLVDVSRPEDAPLHKAFEWNNDVAAERYREHQARYIVRSLSITRLSQSQEPTRAFVALKRTGKEHEYHKITLVLEDKDDRAQLLKQAHAELRAFKRKYAILSELAEVFNAIKQLEVE